MTEPSLGGEPPAPPPSPGPPAQAAASGPPVAWEPPPPRPAGTRGIGELLAASIDLTRRGLVPLLSISGLQVGGVVLAVLMLVGFADYFASVEAWTRELQALAARPRLGPIPAMPIPPPEMIAAGVVVAIGWSAIYAALILAMMSAANDLVAGRPVAIERSLSEGVGRLPAAIGVAVLGVAAMAGFWVVLALIFIGLAVAGVAALTFLLFLVAIPALIVVAVRLLPTISVLVAEDAGPGSAFERAWRLTSMAAWFTFGFTIVAGIIGGIAVGIVAAVVNLVAQPAGDTFGLLGSFASSVVVTPWTAVTGMVLYDELRRRREKRDSVVGPPVVTASGWSA